MEPKKNPKYDVHQKRGVLLNVGLIVSLTIVICAFKWSIPVGKESSFHHFDKSFQETLLVDDPRNTEFKKTEILKPRRIKVSAPLTANFKEIKDIGTQQNQYVPATIDDSNPNIDGGGIELPAEILPPDTFRIVEKMPEPIGGWAAFYQTLSKNLKYPKQAQRLGEGGKVFVEFTVNDKGELSHFKTIKGIGFGCDEEAKRVLALTKWTAGKQRGRPVNVKMVLPILFSMR